MVEEYQEPDLLSYEYQDDSTAYAEYDTTYMEEPIMEIPVLASASREPIDWQALITWIIGSLNGVFGLIIMAKKVFGKGN